MLVFSRKVGQRVNIEHGSETLTIEVLEVRGNRIRLGFTGPVSMNIQREEAMKEEPIESKSS